MQEPTNTSTPESSTNATDTTTPATSSSEIVETVTTTDASSPTSDAVLATSEAVAAAPTLSETVAAATPVVPAVHPRRQMLKQYGIAFIIVLLMGVALTYQLEKQGRIHIGIFDKITALIYPEPTAVVVNGEKVPQSVYTKNYEQLALQAASQGAQATDPATAEQIKKQAIDVLVNSTLLKQAARKSGIKVSKEQIDERYQGIVDAQGGADALAARMAELKITKESLMLDIEDEILIQTHLDTAIDKSKVTVSPEEIQTLYKSVSSNPDVKVPPLEEVRTQIEQEIRFGKEQELISEYIDTLKKDATIEVRI